MKFKDINAIFSEEVKKYLNEGYILNAGSMGGHQGEIAKVDLRDENEIIRVRLDSVRHSDRAFWDHSGVALIVSRKTIECYKSGTLWSGEMEIVKQRTFWQMQNRNFHNIDWYIEGNDGIEAMHKNEKRAEIEYSGYVSRRAYDKSLYNIGLKLLRKIPGNKSKRLSDITSFYRVRMGGHKAEYYVRVKGHDIKVA